MVSFEFNSADAPCPRAGVVVPNARYPPGVIAFGYCSTCPDAARLEYDAPCLPPDPVAPLNKNVPRPVRGPGSRTSDVCRDEGLTATRTASRCGGPVHKTAARTQRARVVHPSLCSSPPTRDLVASTANHPHTGGCCRLAPTRCSVQGCVLSQLGCSYPPPCGKYAPPWPYAVISGTCDGAGRWTSA